MGLTVNCKLLPALPLRGSGCAAVDSMLASRTPKAAFALIAG
jgi:hypothetical protein